MRRYHLVWLFVGLAINVPSPLRGGEKDTPAELDFVAADAVGFVHVRLSDVWKSEFLEGWRETVMKAGDKSLKAFDERFFPRPSSVERVTIFFTMPKEGERQRSEEPVFIFATSKAIDQPGFLKSTMPGAKVIKTENGVVHVDAREKMEVAFPNDQALMVGPPGAVQRVLSGKKGLGGNLTGALKLVRSGKPIVVAFNPEAIPHAILRSLPPAFEPLAKAKLVTLTLELENGGQIDLRVSYANAEKATEAETAAKDAIKMGRVLLAKARLEMEKRIQGDGKPASLEQLPEAASALLALGSMRQLEDYLDTSPIKKAGNDLLVSAKLPKGAQAAMTSTAILGALLVPAVQKVREAASRTQSMNHLKQISLAMHNHHGAFKKLPAAAICDKDGKPLLSWRVAILPFIEEAALYREFKLDEPWDSKHNKKLIARMPSVYVVPAAPEKLGETHYRVFVGGGAGFELAQPLGFGGFTDGLSNTIMVVEAAESVPWTKPDELVYDAKKPLPKFGNFYGNNTFLLSMFDCSVRSVHSNVAERALRAAITRAGGEVEPLDD